ncbi:MAG: hypothetical protein H0U59_12860 [Gemmatimonadaceae bacterium]|nr:hypothetical protein [Gemmatimonadaceae bacterium]
MSDPVGFEKLAFAPRLSGAAIGAGLGYAASPEDEGATGAVMGAGLGYGAGALGSYLHGRLGGAPAGPPVPGATPSAGPSTAGVDDFLSGRTLSNEINAAAAAKGVRLPPSEIALAHAPKPVVFGHRQEAMRRAGRWPQPVPLPPGPRGTKKVGFEKISDYGVSAGFPGLGVSVSSKDERLEGMHRWIPRDTIEQAYEGVDSGLDDTALLQAAAESGGLVHPAVGAGIGAALAHFGLDKSNRTAKALGALVGGGAGALYNSMTRGQRQDDMGEALRGVHHEKRKTHNSANESTPMVVSTGGET